MQSRDVTPPEPDDLDREALRAIGHELGSYFPQPLQETKLVLMEISPHRLHAYWHITAWDLEAARHHTGGKKGDLVLRFHDLTDERPPPSHPSVFDIEISQPSGCQYLEMWEDAKRYVAELGIRTENGLLVDLAKSNTVELPRAEYAAAQHTRVLTLTPQADDLFQPIRADAETADSLAGERRQAWQANDSQPADLTLESGHSRLQPSFPDPSQLPAKAPVTDPFLASSSDEEADREDSRADLEERPAGTGMPDSSDHDTGDQPRAGAIASADDKTRGEAQHAPNLHHSPGFPSADLLTETSDDRLRPLPSSAAPAPGVPIDATATGVAAPSSWSNPVSSFSLGGIADETLQVELHIQGRSRPNSRLVFYGQSILTRDDGSFSLHKRLPNNILQRIVQLLETSREK